MLFFLRWYTLFVDKQNTLIEQKRSQKWRIHMKYGLIGEKLGHSYSKGIHEKLASYTYDITPLTKDEFKIFMKKKEFSAINVTIPYKEAVIPYLDGMDERAKAIGAVNTIVHKDGKLIGHNTDFAGFLYMLEKHNINPAGKKCLVLGSGGACKAVVAVLESMQAKEIYIVGRTAKENVITYEDAYSLHNDAEILINTTPVGMYPNMDASPIDVAKFKSCTAAVDIIYNPKETMFSKQAKELGIYSITGLEMLIAQAKYAVEFFLETSIDDKKIDEIYDTFEI